MLVIPAIDLYAGEAVRLYQGDFEQVSSYGNPLDWLAKFSGFSLPWLHLVDLQGARDPAQRQWELIEKLCSKTQMKIQCGGGIRSLKDCRDLVQKGVERVLVGSLSAREPQKVSTWVSQLGTGRLSLALDLIWDRKQEPQIRTGGWKESSPNSLESVVSCFENHEDLWILCTDISRDGTLKGPALDLYSLLQKRYPQFNWIASGGIRSKEDLEAVSEIGCTGAVLGKALFENRIDLSEVNLC